MNPSKVLLVLIFGLSLPPLAGCGSRKERAARNAEVDRLPHLEYIHPEKQTHLVLKRSYTVIIDALEKAELTARVRGEVKVMSPNADIGRNVTKNEALVILDVPDILADQQNKKALLDQSIAQQDQAQHNLQLVTEEINEAKAEEAKHQAEMKYRESQYGRFAQLAKLGTVTPEQADEAKLQFGAAQAAVRAAQAKILTKQAKYEAAKVEIKVAATKKAVAEAELARVTALVGFATIRAPFDGVVTKRWVDTGAIVRDAMHPLLTVMRTDIMRVIMDVPERDLRYLRNRDAKDGGNRVSLFVPALHDSRPELDFKGTITLTAAALDPVTRTMRVEMHLPNTGGYLRPQMSGTATVTLAEHKGVTVPATALVRRGEKTLVYYISHPTGEPPRGIVRPMEVQLGLDDGVNVEITAPRFTGQELIVRKGNGVIREGSHTVAVPARLEELQ